MPYFRSLNLLFIHVPKTGGRSIEDYFKNKYKLKVIELLSPSAKNTILPEARLQKVSLRHQTYRTISRYRDLLKVDFNDKLRIFSVVRNPYHRIISDLFFYKLIKKDFKPEQVFEVIKIYLGKECYDNHNLPQYHFLVDDKETLVPEITIFHSETLTQNMKAYGFEDFKGPETSPTYDSYLNQDSIELINRIFERDFILFGYPIKTFEIIPDVVQTDARLEFDLVQ